VIRFDGRVAVVTGAGRGLGAAYARALADRGAALVVHDAGVGRDGEGDDPSVADAVVTEIRGAGGTAVASHENLGSEAGCARVIATAVDEFGRLDVLVNNAGLVLYQPIEEAVHSWERLRRVNVDAPFHLSRAAFPLMKRQRYGRIVFTTSGIAMSAEDTRPGLAAYAAGKMAQFGLMVVFAAEGAEHGIRANAISPVAATRIYTGEVRPGELEPEQVAPGVVYLASEACDANGVVLGAAGGLFATRRWWRDPGVDFGKALVTPEQIQERWAEISGGEGD
jgi:NAD(P)-dependent dehydrogenase (short-subunit alcohol dehydrogenase family)